MPFVSESQRRACWAKYNKDISADRKPAWDCKAWEKETPKGKLPYKASSRAQMPTTDRVYEFKRDLETFSHKNLEILAKHLQIPGYQELGKNDLCWVIALQILI